MNKVVSMRNWVLALCVTVAGLGASAPVRADSSLAIGAAAAPRFETHDLTWRDEARHREVPVRLYWPASAGDERALPLVVFSHGIGGSRRGYSYLGSHFASHGIASLHLQHVGSDRSLWTGNPLTLLFRLQGAARDGEAIDRVRDLSFALDSLLATPGFGQRIDSARIVAAGHSYGANTALLAAGARVRRAEGVVSLRDARIKAALLLSAPPFYGEGELLPVLGAIAVPSLHITATEDVIRIPGFYSPHDDRIAVFEAIGSERKTLAVFQGGSHSVFTDRAVTGGATLNPRVKQATKELALAFLNDVFDGVGGLGDWSARHQDIVARVVEIGR
jgi:predicted dienelactone hydrolase